MPISAPIRLFRRAQSFFCISSDFKLASEVHAGIYIFPYYVYRVNGASGSAIICSLRERHSIPQVHISCAEVCPCYQFNGLLSLIVQPITVQNLWKLKQDNLPCCSSIEIHLSEDYAGTSVKHI